MMDSSWTKGGDTVSLVLLGFDSTSPGSHTIILAMLPYVTYVTYVGAFKAC
jgi:hypothetical protein